MKHGEKQLLAKFFPMIVAYRFEMVVFIDQVNVIYPSI
jgi:hypothetical protein